jgi:hypothetical protein
MPFYSFLKHEFKGTGWTIRHLAEQTVYALRMRMLRLVFPRTRGIDGKTDYNSATTDLIASKSGCTPAFSVISA